MQNAAQQKSARQANTVVNRADELDRDLRAEAALIRRIEEQAKALRAAEAARESALNAVGARGALLATTSHEMRTPLNAIIGFSEILKTEMFGPLANDRYREYAKIIFDSGNRLLSLVNDVLDMSKAEAGKIEMHFASVDIFKVIVDCVRTVEPLAKTCQVGIRVSLHDGVDWLQADSKRLHQMLLNLLSNALKFTREGGEICISAYRRGAGVAISVSDTGIGIEEDDIPKILEPFGQVDSDLSRRHEGTGLGLPLTKELAELHGGTLLIESTVGVGTTITIELPYNPPAPRAN